MYKNICEYSEHKSALECTLQYNTFTPSDAETLEEGEEYALEWLKERTTVIQFDGGIIIQQF
jgi:hypothetical protein